MPETPETCTCGTILVENASFCHRCGRAVRPLTAEVETPPEPVIQIPIPVPVAPPQALPIGFSNPIALRVAFLMSLGVMLTEVLPYLNLLFFGWWLGAGWAGVRLYRRLTGLTLSIAGGARLGSLTGLFTFLSMSVAFALMMISSAGKEMLDQMVKQDPRMTDVVNNPPMLAAVLLMVLATVGVVVIGVCAAGGALGARFERRAS